MSLNRRAFLAAAASTTALHLTAAAGTRSTSSVANNSRLIVDGLDTSVINEEFLQMAKASGVNCVHTSCGSISSFGRLYQTVDQLGGMAAVATTVDDIIQAKTDGKIALICGFQEATIFDETISKTIQGRYEPLTFALRAYYQLGLRVLGICYNVANVFGGGCMDSRVPLTRSGKRLVDEVHKLGILLDVGGHTGEQTSLDAIAYSPGLPVVCTHTNVGALNPNPRAISDRLAEVIAGSGGVIGLTAINDFHNRNPSNSAAHGARSPQVTLDVHLDQYDYLKRLVGVDHIGLGPDFPWGWSEMFSHKAEGSVTFPETALSDGRLTLVKDFEDISMLPNLINGLRGRGWTEGELDKVLGGNWMRVYKRVWKA